MSGKRQNIQLELAFDAEGRSEAPRAAVEGTEPSMADRGPERPVLSERLMEEVVEPRNMKKALKRVMANKGAAGIDGVSVDQLPGHLQRHWPAIREQLLAGTYVPQPVRRVQIPKPSGGSGS